MITDQDFIAKCQADGYADVERKPQPANFQAQMHTHPFDARVLVVAGEMRLQRASGIEVIRPGSFCDVPSGEQHAEGYGPEGAQVVVCKRHRDQRAA